MNVGSNDSIKGFIFEYELYNMIKNHPDFSNTKHGHQFTKTLLEADIVTEYSNASYIIECKSSPAFSNRRLDEVIKSLLQYKKSLGIGYRLVLAFPGELNSIQIAKLMGYMIEVWDIHKIAELFSRQISYVQSTELKQLLLSANKKVVTMEDEFIRKLKDCPKGNSHWSSYQKLCGEIFEHVFCPTLGRPILELSDYVKANRRDIIMPNYSETGFWYYIRQRYRADYIIIDAKNHSTKIDKSVVLQMSNYLKDYGVGMFGIVAYRSSLKESVLHTQREVWVTQQKLIIFLNDTDLENMLIAKRNSNEPEEIVKQKIEDFRLSL